jgi:hypothetical protein
MPETPNKITCPTCGKLCPPKALACRHCGNLLHDVVSGDSLSTLLVRRPEALDANLPDESPFLMGTAKLTRDSMVHISIERQNAPITRYIGDNPIVLGRIDKTGTVELAKDDINLSPYKARERGVSRRHAQIYQKGGVLYIEDLGSSNGTSVNGESIKSGVPTKVRDGDEIMLGRMMLWVNF